LLLHNKKHVITNL